MSVVYGYEPSPRGDPLVRIIGNALDLGVRVLTPEKAILLKTFPFCELNFLHEKELIFVHVLTYLECSTEVT
jgi:hypothetical protein